MTSWLWNCQSMCDIFGWILCFVIFLGCFVKTKWWHNGCFFIFTTLQQQKFPLLLKRDFLFCCFLFTFIPVEDVLITEGTMVPFYFFILGFTSTKTHTLLPVLYLNFLVGIHIFIFVIFLHLRRCFSFSISIISLHLPPAWRCTCTHAATVGVNIWTAVLSTESTQITSFSHTLLFLLFLPVDYSQLQVRLLWKNHLEGLSKVH